MNKRDKQKPSCVRNAFGFTVKNTVKNAQQILVILAIKHCFHCQNQYCKQGDFAFFFHHTDTHLQGDVDFLCAKKCKVTLDSRESTTLLPPFENHGKKRIFHRNRLRQNTHISARAFLTLPFTRRGNIGPHHSCTRAHTHNIYIC